MQKAFQDSSELWRLYCEQWKGFVQPWAEPLRRAPWHFGQASTGNGSALIEFANLYWDAYEGTFGRLLESPSLGHTREMNEDLLRGFDAWLDYRRASFEYQVTPGGAWIDAFEEIMRRLVAQAEKGETVPGVRKLLFLWVDVVDHTFMEVFRSEEYILIQGQLVNAATTYRLREREIADAFLKASHLPSRSELDEGYRRIYELRKEVKELRKAVQEIKEEASAKPTKEAAVGTPADLPNDTAGARRQSIHAEQETRSRTNESAQESRTNESAQERSGRRQARRPAEKHRREVDRPHPESLSLLDDDRRDDRSS
jgi:poly[(R)-3-hydroxyalkanoate] polymerase subunit PhaE